jgi:hypothetical protein
MRSISSVRMRTNCKLMRVMRDQPCTMAKLELACELNVY